MRTLRYGLVVFLIGCCVLSHEGFAFEPTPGYTAIQRAFLREDFDTVATLAQTFLSLHPDAQERPRVWVWLALSLDRLHRWDEALSEMDHLRAQLTTDDPLWPELLFWEGEISRHASRWMRAKLAYQRLLERHPGSMWAPQAQFGIGVSYLQQQAFDIAVGHLHEVAVRFPHSSMASEARLLEGVCLLRLERFHEAVAILTPLLATLSDGGSVAQVAFYLGESLTGLKRYSEAVVTYQRVAASSEAPWHRFAQFGLGWAYYQSGRCEEGVSAFDRYLASPSNGEHSIEAVFAQGSCLLQLGRESEALTRFERVMSEGLTHPLAVDSGLLLADAYRKAERLDEARRVLHRLLTRRLAPLDQANVQLRLAGVALEQGNPVQARTIYELARMVDDPAIQQSALNGLGDVQLYLGELDAAMPWYRKAIGLSSKAPPAAYGRYQLGRILLQRSEWQEALRLFREVVGSAEGTLADDATLAMALVSINQHEDATARALLESLRQRRPHSEVAARAAYYLALLALSEEDEAAARALCQETIAHAPSSDEAIDARLLLADMLAQQTSMRTAAEWLEEVHGSARLSTRHRAKLAKSLGDYARLDSQYARAIRWYEQAVDGLPSFGSEVAYRVASCYEEAGDGELAMRWYQRAQQPPWRVRGQLALAKLFERDGRRREAKAIYERLSKEPIPEAAVAQERLSTEKE